MKKAPKRKKYAEGGAIPMPVYAPEFGTIYVNENQVKDLPDWKPGEQYEFTVKAELTELSIDEYASNPKDKDKMRGRFKIKKVINAK